MVDEKNDFLKKKEAAIKMTNKNFEYFIDNLDELLKLYNGKFIAIKDCTIIGAYNSFDAALVETTKTEKVGTFIIQECVSKEEMTSMFFSNNVSFCGV